MNYEQALRNELERISRVVAKLRVTQAFVTIGEWDNTDDQGSEEGEIRGLAIALDLLAADPLTWKQIAHIQAAKAALRHWYMNEEAMAEHDIDVETAENLLLGAEEMLHEALVEVCLEPLTGVEEIDAVIEEQLMQVGAALRDSWSELLAEYDPQPDEFVPPPTLARSLKASAQAKGRQDVVDWLDDRLTINDWGVMMTEAIDYAGNVEWGSELIVWLEDQQETHHAVRWDGKPMTGAPYNGD